MDKEWCDHCVRFCIPRRERDLYETSSCSFCGKILSDNTFRGSATAKLSKTEFTRKKRGIKVKHSTKEKKHYSTEEENALGCVNSSVGLKYQNYYF